MFIITVQNSSQELVERNRIASGVFINRRDLVSVKMTAAKKILNKIESEANVSPRDIVYTLNQLIVYFEGVEKDSNDAVQLAKINSHFVSKNGHWQCAFG